MASITDWHYRDGNSCAFVRAFDWQSRGDEFTSYIHRQSASDLVIYTTLPFGINNPWRLENRELIESIIK